MSASSTLTAPLSTGYLGVESDAVVNYFVQVVPRSPATYQGPATITGGSLNIDAVGTATSGGVRARSGGSFVFGNEVLGAMNSEEGAPDSFLVDESLTSFKLGERYGVGLLADTILDYEGDIGSKSGHAEVDAALTLCPNLADEFEVEFSPNLTPTPEPATWLLLLPGSLGICGFRRGVSAWGRNPGHAGGGRYDPGQDAPQGKLASGTNPFD